MSRRRIFGVRRASSLVRWVVIAAVAVAALAGVYAAYAYMRPVVTVTEVVEGPVVQAFYATGTMSPVREYPVRSNTAGLISEVFVDKGSRVTKGQSLAVVIDSELLFREKQAEAELRERQARADEKSSPVLQEYVARIKLTGEMLAIARREELRQTRLLEQNAASSNDLDRAMDRVKELSREVESLKAQQASKGLELEKDAAVAEAALKIARWNLEQQTLKSPIDGVVLDRPTPVGTRVAVNDHVMQVADVRPKNLVIRASVDEEDVTRVSVDPPQEVRMTLYAFPGRVFTGKVAKIYDKADPDRRTFEVDVKVNDTEPRFAAGMTGELAFILAAKQKSTVVPSQALQDGHVYTVTAHGHLRRVDAEIGLKSVERVELLSGLQPGDRVVISPIGTLRDGQHVRVNYVDPFTAAGANKPKAVNEGFKGFN